MVINPRVLPIKVSANAMFSLSSRWQVSTEDLGKYNTLAQQQAKKLFPSFNMSKFYAAENADPLVFCHFAENIQDQIYDQVRKGSSLKRPLRAGNRCLCHRLTD